MSSTVRAIGDKVIFTFLDDVSGNRFNNVTESGIVYKNAEDTLNQPRWGVITSVGSGVKEPLKVGDHILIDALRWTEKLVADGVGYWATSEGDILCVKE